MTDSDKLDRVLAMLEHLTTAVDASLAIATNHSEVLREHGVALDLILKNQTDHAIAIRLLQQDTRTLRNDITALKTRRD
ncbi:MAG TPA: hypothetical protein VHT52_17790 [Stellaceae bacterium]|jgi:hypothetical protein|nr:hypothetical protein [Stellaceae bacterium]